MWRGPQSPRAAEKSAAAIGKKLGKVSGGAQLEAAVVAMRTAMGLEKGDRAVAAEAALAAENAAKKTKAEKDLDWPAEELAALIKAAKKFGPGSRNRWPSIAQFVAHHSGCKLRSQEQCAAMADAVAKGAGKAGALGLGVADVVQPTRAPTKAQMVSAQAAARAKAAPSPAAAAAAASLAKPSSGSQAKPAKPAAAATVGAGLWSGEQQKALEAAMRKCGLRCARLPSATSCCHPPDGSLASRYTKTDYPEKYRRWIAIAEQVEDKNMDECMARFAQLAAAAKAKKKAAGK